MRYLTLFNRTSRVLEGMWDGRVHLIQPGRNQFPEVIAWKFRDQHPLMGSQDPYSLEKQYLCTIEEEGEPTSPLEQSDSIELLDRSKLRNPIPVVVVQGQGLYSPHQDGRGAPQVDTNMGFIKP